MPTRNLLEGLRQMEPLEMFPWDDYYARMAQQDFLTGRHRIKAVKSFFVRKAPFGGSYILLGGLTSFLRQLDEYRFTPEVCEGLREQGFRSQWIEYVRSHHRLSVRVLSHREGSVFLPNEPVVTLIGPLHDLRLAEGMLLPRVNPASLWLTKWHRVVLAADPAATVDFARRRAQDPFRSTLYAYLAGCSATSNSEMRRWFGIPLIGTMGHEYIQGYGDEFKAFDDWLTHNPDRPTLLVDTINTLQSGVPHAIRAFKRHRKQILALKKIPAMRIDSGDLAYLALASIAMCNKESLPEVCVILTNDLDEYVITSIKQQIMDHAQEFGLDPAQTLRRIISFPAGTMPGTCYDQPSLGGVMKLTALNGHPCIKISDNPTKTSIPGFHSSAFVWRNDELVTCLLHLFDEKMVMQECIHPDDKNKRIPLDLSDVQFEHRQYIPYDSFEGDGFTQQWEDPTLDVIRERVLREVARLNWSYKRLDNPHQLKLSLTPALFELRQRMIAQCVLRADFLKPKKQKSKTP